MKNILEMIRHVGILEQHSTNSLSWFVTVSHVKRSVVQRKVVSEVLRNYDVCVRVQLRHSSINPETGISYANLGPETEE